MIKYYCSIHQFNTYTYSSPMASNDCSILALQILVYNLEVSVLVEFQIQSLVGKRLV